MIRTAGFEGALYFFNKSADAPEGNGVSLRWGAYGLAFCDKDGNTVIDLTEDHQTIREAWKPDTWYQMVVFLLSDGRIALSIQVAAYDPVGDSFTITEALNGGNPYWPGAWSTLDAAMTRNSGYVHFTVNTADIAGGACALQRCDPQFVTRLRHAELYHARTDPGDRCGFCSSARRSSAGRRQGELLRRGDSAGSD